MCLSPIIFRGLMIPCGKCIQCRRKRISEWSCKGMCELQTSKQAWFITLTYNEENYPEFGCLEKTEFQKFMKRFRKSMEPLKIRFIGCGEYGEKFHRPHYHLVIFLKEEKDYEFIRRKVECAWKRGFVSIRKANGGAVRYVCKYCAKDAGEYSAIDGRTGEFIHQFVLFSRRPGIGSEYYSNNWLEMLYNGKITFSRQLRRKGQPRGELSYGIPQSFKRKFRSNGIKVYRHDYSLVRNDLINYDKWDSSRSKIFCESNLYTKFDIGLPDKCSFDEIPLSSIRYSFDQARQRGIDLLKRMEMRGKFVKLGEHEKSIYKNGDFSEHIWKYPYFIINNNFINKAK